MDIERFKASDVWQLWLNVCCVDCVQCTMLHSVQRVHSMIRQSKIKDGETDESSAPFCMNRRRAAPLHTDSVLAAAYCGVAVGVRKFACLMEVCDL